MTHLKRKYDLPDMFYIDLWPLGPVFLTSCSVDSLNLVDTHLSMGKHVETDRVLSALLGKDVIPALNGPLWQQVHRMLQPAFRPQNIKQLLSKVAVEARLFCDKLERVAKTGEVVSMEHMAGLMLFEINAKTIVGTPFKAQEGRCQIMEDLSLPSEVWHLEDKTWNPIEKFRLRRARVAALKRSSQWLDRTMSNRYLELKAGNAKSSNNILDNCLIDRIEAEKQGLLKPMDQDQPWKELLSAK